MSKSGITFQPKPDGNHYVTIHLAYKVITDGKASTAGLLSVFEYLAESSLARQPDWQPGDQIPDLIKIEGTCSNALLMKLLDGLIKESALKSKIRLLEELGYIKTEIVSGRWRHAWYCYAAISNALASPSRFKGSKSDGSKNKGSKSDGLRGQKVTATIPSTIPITNPLSNPQNEKPSETLEREGDQASSQSMTKPVSFADRIKSTEQNDSGIPIADLEKLVEVGIELANQGLALAAIKLELLQVAMPWETKASGPNRFDTAFLRYVADKQYFSGDKMAGARGFLNNCRESLPQLQKVADHWHAYQESSKRRADRTSATQITRPQVGLSGQQLVAAVVQQPYRDRIERMFPNPIDEDRYRDLLAQHRKLKARHQKLLDPQAISDFAYSAYRRSRPKNTKGPALAAHIQAFRDHRHEYLEAAQVEQQKVLATVERSLGEVEQAIAQMNQQAQPLTA